MEKYGVVLATCAYPQESSGLERPRGPVETHWGLNPVFQEGHARVPGHGSAGSESGLLRSLRASAAAMRSRNKPRRTANKYN